MTLRRRPSPTYRTTTESVGFGAASPGAAETAGDGVLTFTHTCGADDTLLMVGVAVGMFDGGQAGTFSRTVTYDGRPMASAGAADSGLSGTGANDGFCELFYQLLPTIGSKPVVVTVGGGAGASPRTIIAGAVSYTGAASVGAPVVGSADIGATPSVSVPSATDHMVAAVFASGNTIATPTDNARVLTNLSTANGAGNLLIQDQAGAATAVLGADANGDIWAWVAVDIIPGIPVPPSSAPAISSIVPNPAPAGAVTIYGTNFLAGASVTFAGVAATNVVVNSTNQISCTTPGHVDGVVNVVVVTSEGPSDPFLFAYQAQTQTGFPYTFPFVLE